MNNNTAYNTQPTELSPNERSSSAIRSVRYNHLDWVRALVVFLLIPFHTAWIFLGKDWLIANVTGNLGAIVFYQLLDLFQMPLLFTIAGIAAWFSLDIRSGTKYLIERVGRLFIPIVFGMLIFNAPIYYFSMLYHGQGKQFNSYFIWYQTYLKTMLFPWQKNWAPGTLWFIWYLLIYSLCLLPILSVIRKHINSPIGLKLGELFDKRGFMMFLLLAILPVLVQLYPPPNAYSNFQISYFVFFFVYGFLIYSSQEMRECVYKYGLVSLIMGIVVMIFVMLLICPNLTSAPLGHLYWHVLGDTRGSYGQELYLMLRGISCWFLIIGLLFLSRRFVNFNNRFLQYVNEAVLPFYVMHATFIIAIGYYVVPMNISIFSKFFAIGLPSLVATIILFEVLKRFTVTRFILGMRIKRKQVSHV